MLPVIGQKLGPYEVLAKLGEGGMGEVFGARDTRLDRSVAIKVVSEAFARRFEREGRALAALNHPHSAPSTTSDPTIWSWSSWRARRSGSC